MTTETKTTTAEIIDSVFLGIVVLLTLSYCMFA